MLFVDCFEKTFNSYNDLAKAVKPLCYNEQFVRDVHCGEVFNVNQCARRPS